MTSNKTAAPRLASKKVLTLEIAKLMAQTVEDFAAGKGLGALAVTIVDDGGNMLLFHRMTGVVEGGARYSRLKAQTSGLLGSPTRFIGDKIDFADPKRPLGIAHVEFFTVTPGGFPIRAGDGQLLGGIGVSGAAAEDDEAAAQAAIDAVKPYLG
ncbi:MAG: heme-binding protein [Alphaproteobacteria bacterium]|nr:heme-binding protein [Alphaproteobacteria bacterium]